MTFIVWSDLNHTKPETYEVIGGIITTKIIKVTATKLGLIRPESLATI